MHFVLKNISLILGLILLSANIHAQSFIKNLGEDGVNDGPTFLKEYDNFFLLAGYEGRKSFITKLDLNGKIIWTKKFSVSDYIHYISDIIIDGDYLVGCGYGHESGGKIFEDFYFKINLQNQEFVWLKSTNLKLKPNNIHKQPNGNYLITGDEYANHKFGVFLMTLNGKNGKKDNFTTWYFAGRESASTSFLNNNILYVGGRYALKDREDKYRAAISAFNPTNFEHLWTKYYLNSRNSQARSYLSNLVLDNDTIVASFFTNNTGITGNYTASFAKIDLVGDLLWAFEYIISGYSNITVRDLKSVSDGYLLYGFTKHPTENLFIIKLDKEGLVSWAKIYGESLNDNILADQGSFLHVKNNQIYFTSQSRNYSELKDYNTILYKTPLNPIDETCIGVNVDVELKSYLDLIEGEINLSRFDTILKVVNAVYATHPSKQLTSVDVCKIGIDEEILAKQESNNPYSFDSIAFNNVSIILDVSLSMNRQDRLPLLKNALYKVMEYMRFEDKISVITYGNDAHIALDGLAATEVLLAKEKIEPLKPGGQSNVNILKSVELAYKSSKNNFQQVGNNRIILTTDGNISKDKLEALKSFVLKQKSQDTYFTVFLFNNSSVYRQQLQDFVDNIGGELYIILPENIDEILLKELKAVQMK